MIIVEMSVLIPFFLVPSHSSSSAAVGKSAISALVKSRAKSTRVITNTTRVTSEPTTIATETTATTTTTVILEREREGTIIPELSVQMEDIVQHV